MSEQLLNLNTTLGIEVYRSKASQGSSAVDGLRRVIVQSLDASL